MKRLVGTIKHIPSSGTFGFIDDGSPEDVFFHREKSPDFDLLHVGDTVEYTLIPGDAKKAREVSALPSAEGIVGDVARKRTFLFIITDSGEKVFLHANDLEVRCFPLPGDRIRFSLTQNAEGPKAVKARIIKIADS